MKTSDLLSYAPELTESLACVIDRLHRQHGDQPRPEFRPSLVESAGVFLDRLAEHIAESEDLVFPALGTASSDTTPRFKKLKSDHGTLHSSARRLVVRILKGHDVLDAARVLLVQLLQHIRSEDDVTSRSLDLLGGRVRLRLARGVSMRRGRLDRRRGGEYSAQAVRQPNGRSNPASAGDAPEQTT